jgi:hypothetical protein
MSALASKADIDRRGGHVRFVPEAAVSNRSKKLYYSITSSICASSDGEGTKPSARAVFILSRFRDALQTRGHIHPIAVDVSFLHDHIAEIDSDAEFDPLLAGNIGVCDRASHVALRSRSAPL